ncbi:unnamed protein product [Cuscuta epithymum]|uniref:ubiquitinyl hydrolase 1 n=1 Tax=Cuscuta epithymum TaxID=186058 RepID=A0AAV0F2R9_9ASTE|nr:unnamed protein product [Cuscuta epithymum]
MGKKVKKKARNVQNEKRVHAASSVSQQSRHNTEGQEEGVIAIKEIKMCPHVDKKLNLEKVSAKMGSSESLRCEECTGGDFDNRSSKGKNKHVKKKVGVDKAIWICLECGHFSCGGVGLPTTPQSHAVRHSKKFHHSLAVQYENPHLIWCFPCNKLIPFNKTDDNGEHKKVLLEIVKLIKGTQPEVTNLYPDNVYSSTGSGTVTSCVVSKQSDCGYSVRGFINLGNTCFFNSVMQNLMSINKLRDHFLGVDAFVGPLTASMKKLFIETNPDNGLRGIVNPKSVYSSICSKSPQFRGYQQQDSHELLRCLLDGLSTEELSASKKRKAFLEEDDKSQTVGPPFVSAIFGGQLSSTVSCIECGHSSIVYEPFLDLSLPVPTKRPPYKKPPIVTQPKKSKLPPKRSWRVNTRSSKYMMSQPAQNVPEPAVVPQRDASLNYLDVSTLADDMGLFTKVPSANTRESEKNTIIEADTVTSTDEFTWLDFLETEMLPTSQCLTFQCDETETSKYCGNGDSVQKDVSLQKKLESNMEIVSSYTEIASSSDNLTSLNNLEQDDHGIVSQFNEISLPGDCATKDATQAHNSTGFCNHISFSEHNMEINSSIMHLEGEAPVQVKDSEILFLTDTEETLLTSYEAPKGLHQKGSEILLLPYKEETSSISSYEVPKEECEVFSVAGCQQDVDLDGIGSLFDEPEEMVASCSVRPSPSSDSDPDEVDNSDSTTVSVESCLAYFTKPEHLTKTDHAWKCENCSKVFLEQKKREMKALLKRRGDFDVNKYGDMHSQSTPELAAANRNMEGNACNGNMLNVYQKADEDKVSSQLEDMPADQSESSGLSKSFSQLNHHRYKEDGICSSSVDHCCRSHDAESMEDNHPLLQESGSSDSDGTVDEEMDSETVKVERDATKRILIDKPPLILTIHLKRFNQDARGRLSKLNGHVYFKDTLDLEPYTDPRNSEQGTLKYRLLGVVEHSGTMRGGHYIAYVRGIKNGGNSAWYYVSDAHVREVSLEEVLRSEAYILFYEEM